MATPDGVIFVCRFI